MKVAVVGLWHLGSVTAACLASVGYDVIGFDADAKLIENLQAGCAPLFESGLNELIAKGLAANHLNFSHDPVVLNEADLVWVTYDTPVNDEDEADVEWVIKSVAGLFGYLKESTLILISSQLPVGSIAKLEAMAEKAFPRKSLRFACSPENLRLGKAIDVFLHSDRVVVGIRNETDKQELETFINKFAPQICWMSVESAEMTKHALNAFLATSVVFINELASVCEQVGADAAEVERGLKSEIRIGPKAYLKPGAAFAGGTLARDVSYLIQAGQRHQLNTEVFSAVLASNKLHRNWALRRLQEILNNLAGKKITLLGLTYKPGTDTLRRSIAIELARQLHSEQAIVKAYDPMVKLLPDELSAFIQLSDSLKDALEYADAVVICTEWPDFNQLDHQTFIDAQVKNVFDANGFLRNKIKPDANLNYFSVGTHL